MNAYLLTLAAGFAVGLFYSMVGVRSPAPPVIALLGLLGILLGEQVVPLAKRLMAGEPMTVAWVRQGCGTHVFGRLPGHADSAAAAVAAQKETQA